MGEGEGEGVGEGVGEGMGWAALRHLEPLVARLGLHAALVVARVVEVKPQLEALLGPHDACAHEVRQVAVRGEAHAHLWWWQRLGVGVRMGVQWRSGQGWGQGWVMVGVRVRV